MLFLTFFQFNKNISVLWDFLFFVETNKYSLKQIVSKNGIQI